MTRQVVPIADRLRRLPEAGRLRFGVRTKSSSGKERPMAIDTWRVTSHDEQAIRQVAAAYGGDARPWKDAPTQGQWEVTTTASELRIVLPPDPLGNSPIYELWSKGGCQRRCDGVRATVPVSGPDGTELDEVACLCAAEERLSCKPKTRLNVLLPDVRFAGVWRMETGSNYAADELPIMVEFIRTASERGLTRAILGLEHRERVDMGQTHKFIVPVLRLDNSLEELVAGRAMMTGALPSAPAYGELPRASDDEVTDAEIVDDGRAEAARVELRDWLSGAAPSLKELLRGFCQREDIPGVVGQMSDQQVLDCLDFIVGAVDATPY